MTREIEISEEVADILNDIGGTFDSVDDVLRRVLEEAGYAVNDDSWTEEELRSFFDSTTSSKQTTFVTMLVDYEDEWVPKTQIIKRLVDEVGGDNIDAHTLDGVQSSMTRRCKTADREKWWERRRSGGDWEYRVKPPYQEWARDYWLD